MAFELVVSSREPSISQALQGSSLSVEDKSFALLRPGSSTNPSTFRADVFFNQLQAREIGSVILTSATVPSTQMLLHKNFTTFPSGTVFVADEQTTGKGRGKNSWTSPAGCLMFSLYHKLNIAGERLPFVQYVMSLAIVKAIQSIASTVVEGRDLDVRIKWPNDIYAKGLKIGGILCQSVYRDGVFHLIIGAGLNVTNREPTTCLATLIEEQQPGTRATPEDVYREILLGEIANNLETMLDTLRQEGFSPLRPAYLESWLHSNQQVTLEERGAGEEVSLVSLTITGISANGYMTAVDKSGENYELHPDGNSFDFFKGLVRHKPSTAA